MSSFIVSPEVINNILSFFTDDPNMGAHFERIFKFHLTNDKQVTSLVKAMWKLNWDAVSLAYGTAQIPATFPTFKPVENVLIEQAYFSLECFLYQCTEGKIPRKALFKKLQTLSDWMARKIAFKQAETLGAKWN